MTPPNVHPSSDHSAWTELLCNLFLSKKNNKRCILRGLFRCVVFLQQKQKKTDAAKKLVSKKLWELWFFPEKLHP